MGENEQVTLEQKIEAKQTYDYFNKVLEQEKAKLKSEQDMKKMNACLDGMRQCLNVEIAYLEQENAYYRNFKGYHDFSDSVLKSKT